VLQDAAVIWATGVAIDWSEIAARLASDELPHRAFARCWLGTAARLAGLTSTDAAFGAVPALDLCRALSWRISVFCPGADGAGRHLLPIWGPHPLSRSRRLLIDEATRVELGLPNTPLPDATWLDRLGRWVAAAAARVGYRAWRSVRRASEP